MPRKLRTLLAQVGSFLLAGLLLYLALRGVDFSQVSAALREANYLWLGPLTVIVLLAHWLRAWRWQMLLEALPGSERRIPVGEAFSALMIGYLVNYAAPRLGEVVRTANLSARRRVSFSSIFGTVVIERILDAAALAIGLVSVVFLLRGRMGDLHRVFVEPLGDVSFLPLALAALGIVLVSILVLVVGRSFIRRSTRASNLWTARVRPAATSFGEGFLTVFRSRRRLGLFTSTVLIWLCYLLMAHLPFVLLGMSGPYGVSLGDSWSIMLLGAIGIAIPSPGGTGSYHYITVVVLTSFFDFDRAAAATYAVLSHAAQLVLHVIVGFTCILIQGASLRSIRAQAAAAETGGAQAVPSEDRP